MDIRVFKGIRKEIHQCWRRELGISQICKKLEDKTKGIFSDIFEGCNRKHYGGDIEHTILCDPLGQRDQASELQKWGRNWWTWALAKYEPKHLILEPWSILLFHWQDHWSGWSRKTVLTHCEHFATNTAGCFRSRPTEFSETFCVVLQTTQGRGVTGKMGTPMCDWQTFLSSVVGEGHNFPWGKQLTAASHVPLYWAFLCGFQLCLW